MAILIDTKRLKELEAKERAHDVYMEARATMARRRSRLNPADEDTRGYALALNDFDDAIIEADAAHER